MNKNPQKPRDYIKGKPMSKEALYYAILFGTGFVTSLIILIIALANDNSKLSVYAGVITPLFLIASLAATAYILVHRESIYVEETTLVISKPLSTKIFPIANIDKFTAATNNTDGITSINVTCLGKVARYKFKNISKEMIAQLRRITN